MIVICIISLAICHIFSQINFAYKEDLLQQICYQKEMAQLETTQTQRELEMATREEALYQERLRAVLTRPVLDKTHPRRLLATRK